MFGGMFLKVCMSNLNQRNLFQTNKLDRLKSNEFGRAWTERESLSYPPRYTHNAWTKKNVGTPF